MRSRFFIVLIALFVLIPFSLPAVMVLPTDFKSLVSGQAHLVFKGICEREGKETIFYPKTKKQIPVFVYTFKVEEVIKGDAGSTVEFKQWGVRSVNEAYQLGLGPVQTAKFKEGETYLLFLGPASSLGFRHVVGGAGQGVFKVLKDAEGNESVVNFSNNRGLFKGISKKALSKSERSVVQAPSGPVSYKVFTSLVKKELGN